MILAAGSAVDVYLAMCEAAQDSVERRRGRQAVYYLRNRPAILADKRARRDAEKDSARKQAARHPACAECGDPLMHPDRGAVCGFCLAEQAA